MINDYCMNLINDFYIANILLKSVLDQLSEEERERLEAWKSSSEINRKVYENFVSGESLRMRSASFGDVNPRNMERAIWRKIHGRRIRRMHVWEMSLAASVVLIIGLVIIFLRPVSELGNDRTFASREEMVSPKGVVLELSSGERFTLDGVDSSDSYRFVENGMQKSSGKLTYVDTLQRKKKVQVHALYVPRGTEYTLDLSDGTRIRLNSDTKMRYPSYFTGKERQVYLDGEAYFEVARDTMKPFVVKMNGGEVRVLGTKFNLSAYAGEERQTTLVEGKVAVVAGDKKVVLEPGEQAVECDGKVFVREVNTDTYTAWLRNVFVFDNMLLEDILNVS